MDDQRSNNGGSPDGMSQEANSDSEDRSADEDVDSLPSVRILIVTTMGFPRRPLTPQLQWMHYIHQLNLEYQKRNLMPLAAVFIKTRPRQMCLTPPLMVATVAIVAV